MTLILIHLAIAVYSFWESWNAAKQLRLQLIKSIIFGIIGLVHGIAPAVGAPWNMRTPDPYEYHVMAAWYCLIGVLLLGLGWRLLQRVHPLPPVTPTFEFLKEARMQRKLQVMFVVCAVIGVGAWVGSILASGATLMQFLTARRLEFRGQGDGVLGGLCVHLFCTAYVPGFLGPQMNGRFKTAGILYALGFAAILFIFSRGTRAPTLGMMGSLAGGMIFARKVSVEKLFGAALAMGMLAMLAIGMLPLRHRMAYMTYGEMAAFLFSAEAYQDAFSHDPLNYHDHFVSITAIFPETRDYVDAASYRRILFFFVPGEKYPALKPRDPNRIVAEALFGAAAIRVDWMHPPGIFGDAYINFWGWWGLPFLFAEGVFVAWVCRRMVVSPWFFIGLGPQTVFMSLIGIRGQPYAICLAMLSSLSVTFVMLMVLGIPLNLHKKKKSAPRLDQRHNLARRPAAA